MLCLGMSPRPGAVVRVVTRTAAIVAAVTSAVALSCESDRPLHGKVYYPLQTLCSGDKGCTVIGSTDIFLLGKGV